MTTITLDTFSSRTALPGRHARRRGGYSLLEISMVLAIVALLIAGAMLLLSGASDAQKSADTVREVLAVEAAVYSVYGGQSSYSGLSAAVLVGGKQMPHKWISGTGLLDPYAGAVIVYSDPVNTGWDMVVYNLSQKACTDLALSGQQMGSNLVQIVIGTNSANPSTGGVGSYGLTQSAWMSAVVGACTPGTNIRFSMAS